MRTPRGSASRAAAASAASAAAVVVLLTYATTTPASAEYARVSHPGALAGPVLAPASGMYWGAFVAHAPLHERALPAFIRLVRRKPAILSWYQPWNGNTPFPSVRARAVRRKGIVPMVTWEPWQHGKDANGDPDVDQPRYRLRNIARGRFDGYVRTFARAIRNYEGPVMLRPMHEMDGIWYPWGGTVNGNTPKQFVAAWRHLWRVFRDIGATNVTWVWSVNHESIPHTAENRIRNYWPGSKFVDWVGWSGFNPGPQEPGGTWQTFDRVERARYHDLLRYHKPIALTEVAAPEDGGNKARWIRNAFRVIHARYPKLAALVWFNKRGSRYTDWRVNSTRRSLRAFRWAVGRSWVRSADEAALTTQP